MTREENLKILKLLEAAYSQAQFPPERVAVYAHFLRDLPYDLARRAVTRLIATSPYPPTIAEIRKAALTESERTIPDVDSAYEEARMAARRWCPYAPLDHQWSHPLVKRAAEIVGIETLAMTEEPSVVAAQFRQVYERLRRRAVEDLLVPRRLALSDRQCHAPAGKLTRVDDPPSPEPDEALQNDDHHPPWVDQAQQKGAVQL